MQVQSYAEFAQSSVCLSGWLIGACPPARGIMTLRVCAIIADSGCPEKLTYFLQPGLPFNTITAEMHWHYLRFLIRMEGVALVTLPCVGRQLGMCLSTFPLLAYTSTRAFECQLKFIHFHSLHIPVF